MNSQIDKVDSLKVFEKKFVIFNLYFWDYKLMKFFPDSLIFIGNRRLLHRLELRMLQMARWYFQRKRWFHQIASFDNILGYQNRMVIFQGNFHSKSPENIFKWSICNLHICSVKMKWLNWYHKIDFYWKVTFLKYQFVVILKGRVTRLASPTSV